jgi:hypothetical protein
MPNIGDQYCPGQEARGTIVPEWLEGRTEIGPSAKLLFAHMRRLSMKGYCWAKQETLANAIGVEVRTVRNALNELIRAGLVVSTRRGQGKTNIYAFVWHEWIDDAYREVVPVSGERSSDPERQDFPISSYVSERSERTNHGAHSASAPRKVRAAPEENLPEAESASVRKPRRSRDAFVRTASDPAPATDNRVSRTHRDNSGAGLAAYFRSTAEARLTKRQLGVDPFHKRALASKLSQFLREGVTPDEIRTMIDIFVTEPPKDDKPLWISFLGSRARLLDQASQVVADQRPAAERYAAPPVPGWTASG